MLLNQYEAIRLYMKGELSDVGQISRRLRVVLNPASLFNDVKHRLEYNTGTKDHPDWWAVAEWKGDGLPKAWSSRTVPGVPNSVLDVRDACRRVSDDLEFESFLKVVDECDS